VVHHPDRGQPADVVLSPPFGYALFMKTTVRRSRLLDIYKGRPFIIFN
jgi:hypothetical protein